MAEQDVVKEFLKTAPIYSPQNRTNCPVCGPLRKKKNQKSLSVKLDGDDAVYNCHHCGISGSAKISDELPEVASPVATSSLSRPQVAWLSERGISEETAHRCGLSEGTVYIRSRDSEVSCIGFHYQNSDGTRATKWRDGNKNFSQTGAARSLWRLNDWSGGDLLIVEGELDALSFEEVGIFATSVPNGAPSTLSRSNGLSGKYSYLWDAKDKIDEADRIIIATDSDEPGRLLSEEIARRVGKGRCWRLHLPVDCKDPNEVLVKHGRDALIGAVTEATPWPVHGLRDVNEYRRDVLSLHDRGLDQGIKVGIGELDNIYTVCPQTLTVVTGIPGSGKSSFLTWMSVRLAQRHGWTCAVLSAETPPAIHLLQMASIFNEQPYSGRSKMSEGDLETALDWLSRYFVVLDDSDTSIDSVLERAQAAVLRMGVRLLIVDPYNFLTTSGDSEETAIGSINKLLISLKRFCVEHSIACWLVAHPKKMYRGTDGKVPQVTGYDVAGSSAFYNVADAGITVSREGVDSRITIWKARFPWIAKTGSAELSFDMDTGIFSSSIGSWGNLDDDDGWEDL